MFTDLLKYKFKSQNKSTVFCRYWHWRRIVSLVVLITFSSPIFSPAFAADPSAETETLTLQPFDPLQGDGTIPPSSKEEVDTASAPTSGDTTSFVSPQQQSTSESSDHQPNLREKFLLAKKRYQPYINLTNQVYRLSDLLDPTIFNEYKQLELKSLYLRTTNLALDAQFAAQINQLAQTGVRELLLFIHQDQPTISTEQLNDFVRDNKIRINLMMIPVTDRDIEAIRADSIGKNDILGFEKISERKLIYKDAHSLALLNNEETDRLILHNYVEHTRRGSAKTTFELKEPSYITASDNPTDEKRIKNPAAIKRGSKAPLEVSKNIDLDAQVERQLESESELDLDREQADNKFDETVAIQRAQQIKLQCFYEEDQSDYQDKTEPYTLVPSLFASARDMKFITSKALDLVMQNYFLFRDGVDMDNLPIGLAYRNHILFASDQRLASMPINGFTVKPNPIKPYTSNPLEYSWLPFATKASISLNDIYGSDIAPKIHGYDAHPIIKSQGMITDIMLDIPFNSYHITHRPTGGQSYRVTQHFFVQNTGESKRIFLDTFPGIYFYDLSESDQQRLQDIYNNLQTRGLVKILSNIIKSENTSEYSSHETLGGISDGGFLLEEGASLFFKKLFQEILPPSNTEKQKFFREVLEGYRFKHNSLPEDVFEGLDEFYKKLKELMVINKVTDALQEEILTRSISIIKKQMESGSSFKTVLGRFVNILSLITSHGGNIKEQLEYLDSTEGSSILKDPQQYWRAGDLGLNIIHPSLALSARDATLSGNRDTITPDQLIKQISDKDYPTGWSTTDYAPLTNTMRYLTTLPPHQRPSIATYFDHFYALPDQRGHIRNYCYPFCFTDKQDNPKRESLRTMEYSLFDEVSSRYAVDAGAFIFGAIYNPDANRTPSQLEDELGKKYILFVIEDGEITLQIKLNDFSETIKLSELGLSKEKIESKLSDIKQYTKNNNELCRLTESQSGDLIELLLSRFPEISSQLMGKIMNPEMQSVFKNAGPTESIHSPISIKLEGGTYELYLGETKLDKKSLTLPTVLDERIQQCRLNSETCFDITLSPSEMAGTIFESFQAPLVHQPYFGDKSYEEKMIALSGAPKEKTKHRCYAVVGVVTDDSNLVTNFTAPQAAENIKLLALNILSSTGGHYDPKYPDQEFASYVSLFNTLFSDVKVYDDIHANSGQYDIEQDLNYGPSRVIRRYDVIGGSLDKSPEVKDKEARHKRMVEAFINIYKENPSFNFAQVVALGLVDPTLAADTIEKAKILLQYNGHFTQMLRILLSTPISSSSVPADEPSATAGYDELRARGGAIANAIGNLFKPAASQETDPIDTLGTQPLIHDLLTQQGKHPENLSFFAASLGREQEINADRIKTLLSKLGTLTPSLKDQLLDSFATTQLPYAGGEIVASAFPIITLDDLDHPDAISTKIESAKQSQIPSSSKKTIFNDANVRAVEQSTIDFSELAGTHPLSLTDEVKSKRFSDIRKNILEDKDFIKINFTKDLEDQELIQKIHFDVAVAIFSVFSQHQTDWKQEEQKKLTFLFNPKKKLEEQFLEIELNYHQLSKLLSKYIDQRERQEFLDHLLAQPNIPYPTQGEVLRYLNSIDKTALQAKGHTLPTLIKSAGNKIIGQHFDAFKIATDHFMQSGTGISPEELYRHIEHLADAKYSSPNIQRITTYCLEHSNYSIIPILSVIDGQAENIDELVDFMLRISPADIERLAEVLGDNFKTLLAIKEIKKIEILMGIALKLGSDITKDRYSLLVKRIMKNDMGYAKLISSYLLIDNVPKQDRINEVFNHIDHPEAAQAIFSEYHTERFEYDEARVTSKIKEMRGKNTDNDEGREIYAAEQRKLHDLFTQVMAKAKTYSALNINAIRAKAIELKRRRTLLKEHAKEEIEQVDLEYIALAFETLYRSTGMFPRDTQILSVLLSVINSNHTIQEIATGEGKSLIAALQAAYLCFTGQTVDVVTSSQELARKDRQEFALFYQNLGLTVSRSIITAASEISAYEKGGINYAVASDLALFRANREFYSDKIDIGLNTDVSLIGDEVDFVLTSGINFKLATSLIKTTQKETRALFDYIIEFSKTPIFENENLSRQDDVKNLRLYLAYQFLLYDSSYKYPLSLAQLNDLKNSKDPRAPKLHALHRALSKTNKHADQLFDKLLSAVVIAKQLVEGVDYVILKENIANEKALLQVTPIIKDQPSRGTVFGDGVQPFVHLLLEQQHPELKQRFDVSIPSSTIFNISPKNFFDYYRLSGGRIIGMTGTAGSKEEIGEFRVTNKMLTFNLPRHDADRKKVSQEEAKNKEEQYQKAHDILKTLPVDRPVIIFAESTKEAEQVYQEMRDHRTNSQLYAASQKDTARTVREILDNAGKDGYLTVTTPMLGRGTDFYTEHKDGFLGINLCTNITFSTKMQIYGRVARNGHPGEIISIFNRELFGESIESHMRELSEAEKTERMRSQPLTDVLKYFNLMNRDQAINAIKCNEFILKTWSKITEGRTNYAELRGELVQALKKEYPELTVGLDQYLERIDGGIPETTDEPHDDGLSGFTPPYYKYVAQTYPDSHIAYGLKQFKPADQTINSYWWNAESTARSTPLSAIELPRQNTNKQYELFYRSAAKAQYAIMATHAFDLEKNVFKLYTEHEYRLTPTFTSVSIPHEFVLSLDGGKAYGKIDGKDRIEIAPAYTFEKGIPQSIYDGVLTKLQAIAATPITPVELEPQEIAAINKFINAAGYNEAKSLEGEGSNGNLMLYEFKKSFAAYQLFVKSDEVYQIANIINNFGMAKDIDTTKLAPGQYQAINITTLFTTSDSHAESILTDGKLLFWINRGGDESGEKPGIKVFKIIRDLPQVIAAIDWMKEPHSQTDTRTKIYSLLREDSDSNIPGHILIPMPGQTIGNCGWTQTEGMLKAAAIVNRLRRLDILQDDLYQKPTTAYDRVKMFTESQEWQKVLKDSEDIYKDFITYDRVKRLEAMIASMDDTPSFVFHSTEEQIELNQRKQFTGNPITTQLLESLHDALKLDHARYDNTIYEKQVADMLSRIDLEIALGSEMGEALQRVGGKESARKILVAYQKNKQNTFADLNKIYKRIEADGVEDKKSQDALFVTILGNIIDSEYQYFLTQASLRESENWRVSLQDAQVKIEAWRPVYQECHLPSADEYADLPGRLFPQVIKTGNALSVTQVEIEI
ncbi:MAG: hypothetical protein ACD_21C00285G0024 [uncultured bacterium]|nr:MAG: hypothetical protein ACD_21C00285G0024 [uncultured bacterium]